MCDMAISQVLELCEKYVKLQGAIRYLVFVIEFFLNH